MNNLQQFLAGLEVYPDACDIDEASNFGQDKAQEYIHSIDSNAALTVEEGEVYVKWSIEEDENTEEWEINAQSEFDERFSERLEELQNNKI